MHTTLENNFDSSYDEIKPISSSTTDLSRSDQDSSSHVPLNFEAPLTTKETDIVRLENITHSINAHDEISQNKEKKDLSSSVDGAVVDIVKQSVTCELYTLPHSRFIKLPKALFPCDDLRIGLPISLKIDESGGIRKPVVTLRNIDNSRFSRGAEIFDCFS